MMQFQEIAQTDRGIEGQGNNKWKDGKTLFYSTFALSFLVLSFPLFSFFFSSFPSFSTVPRKSLDRRTDPLVYHWGGRGGKNSMIPN